MVSAIVPQILPFLVSDGANQCNKSTTADHDTQRDVDNHGHCRERTAGVVAAEKVSQHFESARVSVVDLGVIVWRALSDSAIAVRVAAEEVHGRDMSVPHEFVVASRDAHDGTTLRRKAIGVAFRIGLVVDVAHAGHDATTEEEHTLVDVTLQGILHSVDSCSGFELSISRAAHLKIASRYLGHVHCWIVVRHVEKPSKGGRRRVRGVPGVLNVVVHGTQRTSRHIAVASTSTARCKLVGDLPVGHRYVKHRAL
mmetsp:Transcript_47122/g.121784  ORF Transcript_47122/g.121784 Transcript_47122/m.121784 type:complete len:254 (+) Transcript_47122:314-1075(+)